MLKSVSWLLALAFAGSSAAAAPAPPLVVAAVPAQSAGQNGWGLAPTDVEPDPEIKFGRLANGMKYAIMRNSTPRGAVSLRLHFRFGSLAEAEHERGLAHFIEHMAFNGSTNVPEGEMKKILERHGLRFGADSNAFTGFDQTWYVLDVPKAEGERLDAALFLLREVASEVRFDPGSVDRERGVIVSERRARDSFQLRRALDNLRFHMPRTPHPDRLPIGTDEVLSSAQAATLVDLYRRYYRPENATLVVVGDADPAAIEAKIKAKFGGWRGKGAAGAPLPRGKVDLERPSDFAGFSDPAVETTASITVFRPWQDEPDTRAERRRALLQSVALGLLTRRLQLVANAPDSKLIGGAAAQSGARNVSWSSTISAVARDGEWASALAVIEQELRRAVLHGFTPSELRVHLADTAGGFKRAANSADTRSSPQLAQSILNVIDENDFVTTPQWRLQFFEAIRPSITLAEVNAELRRLWAGSPPLVFVTDKKPVARSAIQAALVSSRKVAVSPVKDAGRLKFAYESFGTPGKVVADRVIPDLGIRTLRFANNVRLNLKRTDFDKGRVMFSVRLAGGHLALPGDKPGLGQMISSISQLAALEKHSAEDLKQIFAGRGVVSGIAVSGDALVASGSTIPSDIPLQMKLSAAFFTAPGYRPEADARWKALVPVMDAQVRSTAQSLYGAKALGIIANDDPRFTFPDAPILAQRSLTEARSALAPLLASAPIEIALVGDFDEAIAIKAVAETFGAMPARPLDAPSYAEQRRASFRRDLKPLTLVHSGQADQAMLAVAWPTTDDDDQKQAVGLTLLAELLRLELTEKLREELGSVYSPAASASSSDVYEDFGYLSATAIAAPDKLDEVQDAIRDVVAELRARPPGADQLARARNPNLERIDRQQRENGYWLAVVDDAQSDPERIDRHRRRRALYEAVTADDLHRLARTYLSPEKMLVLRVVSDKVPAAHANGSAKLR